MTVTAQLQSQAGRADVSYRTSQNTEYAAFRVENLRIPARQRVPGTMQRRMRLLRTVHNQKIVDIMAHAYA